METIQLKEFSTVLIDRTLWKEVFQIAEKHEFKVIFDFEWIEFLTTSFADEVFAKWIQQYWPNCKFIWIKIPIIKDLIKLSLHTRLVLHKKLDNMNNSQKIEIS